MTDEKVENEKTKTNENNMEKENISILNFQDDNTKVK